MVLQALRWEGRKTGEYQGGLQHGNLILKGV